MLLASFQVEHRNTTEQFPVGAVQRVGIYSLDLLKEPGKLFINIFLRRGFKWI